MPQVVLFGASDHVCVSKYQQIGGTTNLERLSRQIIRTLLYLPTVLLFSLD